MKCEQYIHLRMQGIKEKLHPLLNGMINHPEAKHVLFDGTIKQYKVLMTRLTETREYDGRPAGCLLPIIYRNVFERPEFEDRDEAIELFADWSICNTPEYWEAGLLGNITRDLFDELHGKIGNQGIFTQARSNLEHLDIRTVADWKRLQIFNATMLKIFLKKELNQSVITEKTLTRLE